MLVVISSEAPKKRKIYHKMGCIYAERIKFQNLLEIKVEQAEKEGYCECKYCAGLRGDVRTRKAQMLSWTHKKEMEFKFDDYTETLYIKTKIGFWKIYLKDDIDKYLLYHRNKFEANTDYQELIRGEFHRQKDVKQTDSLPQCQVMNWCQIIYLEAIRAIQYNKWG